MLQYHTFFFFTNNYLMLCTITVKSNLRFRCVNKGMRQLHKNGGRMNLRKINCCRTGISGAHEYRWSNQADSSTRQIAADRETVHLLFATCSCRSEHLQTPARQPVKRRTVKMERLCANDSLATAFSVWLVHCLMPTCADCCVKCLLISWLYWFNLVTIVKGVNS